MDVLNITELLASLGFDSDASRLAARQLLEAHKLTNPRKVNIAGDKLPRVRDLLLGQVVRWCGHPECAALAARLLAGRPVIGADTPGQCAICGGSNQRRALRLLSVPLQDAAIQRLLVVGGGPPAHRQIRQATAGGPVAVRCVNAGNRGHSEREARATVAWAQLIVIWSGTAMKHKASQVYTADHQVRQVLVVVPGIEALCRAVIAAVRPTSERKTSYQ